MHTARFQGICKTVNFLRNYYCLVKSSTARLHFAICCRPTLSGPPVPPCDVRARRRKSSICRSYQNPEIYDIAFSFRNFEQEAAYLLNAYQKHCNGPLTKFLEVGCGPAQHSILLAKTVGSTGIALDISQEMLDYAALKAEAAGVAATLTFQKGDMTRPFVEDVQQGETTMVDMGMVLLGTLAHCLTNDQAINCLTQMTRLIRPGGLLVLELPHPEELFSGSYYSAEQFVDAWDASLDDKTVLVEWGREGDEFDADTQVLKRTVGMSLYEGDKLVSSEVEIVQQRQFTLQEIDLLARLSGLQMASVYGDFDMKVPLDHDDAYRMIVCLTK